MIVADRKIPSVEACDSGFSDRIHATLDSLGIKKHGRGTLLAKWSGMTKGGFAFCLKDDRPPKQPAFESLVGCLAIEASDKNITVSAFNIAQFLLSENIPNPLGSENREEPRSRDDATLYGHIMIRLLQLAEELDYNPFTDFDQRQLDIAYQKVCDNISSEADMDDEAFVDRMKAWVMLAHQHKL